MLLICNFGSRPLLVIVITKSNSSDSYILRFTWVFYYHWYDIQSGDAEAET